MNILAMDTSGPSLSVALTCEGKLCYECTQRNGLTHSQSLMTLVHEALNAGRLSPAEVDCFAAVAGPGSFTGVRIAIATVKALAHATGARCIGINALETLARGMDFFGGTICALQDARAGQVYCAAWRGHERILPDEAMKLTDFLERIADKGLCCFVGDGAMAHREIIVQALGENARFAPEYAMMPRASVVALLALEQMDRASGWQELSPYYLRAPQAERERAMREAAHG